MPNQFSEKNWSRLVAAVKRVEKNAQGARRHSDKEKFRSDLNRPENCKMSERLLKTLRKFADFQAEYEGSNPFICSNVLQHLARAPNFILTNPVGPNYCPSGCRSVLGLIVNRYDGLLGYLGTRLSCSKQGRSQAVRNLGGRLHYRIRCEMGVPRGRLDLRMSKQLSDHC